MPARARHGLGGLDLAGRGKAFAVGQREIHPHGIADLQPFAGLLQHEVVAAGLEHQALARRDVDLVDHGHLAHAAGFGGFVQHHHAVVGRMGARQHGVFRARVVRHEEAARRRRGRDQADPAIGRRHRGGGLGRRGGGGAVRGLLAMPPGRGRQQQAGRNSQCARQSFLHFTTQ